MAQLGQFALALAFVVTAYSIIASLIGIRLKHDNLIASGRNAALAAFVCITTAILCLGYLFAVSDFSIKYIAAHSNRDLPMYFKVSSIWGGPGPALPQRHGRLRRGHRAARRPLRPLSRIR